eukprot:gene28704-34652_t
MIFFLNKFDPAGRGDQAPTKFWGSRQILVGGRLEGVGSPKRSVHCELLYMAHSGDLSVVDIDISEFNGSPVPDELGIIAQDGIVTLLPRQLSGEILNTIVNASSPSAPFYITGPGGVGKSSILFMTAAAVFRHNSDIQQASNSAERKPSSGEQPSKRAKMNDPILLIYVANSGTLVNLLPEEAAGYLCNLILNLNKPLMEENRQLYDILTADNVSNLDCWDNLCSRLSRTNVRCLILIDQWNAIIEGMSAIPKSHPLLRFCTISAIVGTKSMFVAAVSSSFSPLDVEGVFRDATAVRCKNEIQPLSLCELRAVRDIWASRCRPAVVNDDTLNLLHEATGGIPRLCEMFAETLCKDPSVTIDSLGWRRKCKDYYVSRIQSVERHISDSAVLLSFKWELASLFLRNRDLPNRDSKSASRWESSGLLISDAKGQFLVPVNPFVRSAIDTFIFSVQNHLLKALYADHATRWRAIELYISLTLRKGSVRLAGTDLRCEHQRALQVNHLDEINVVEVHRDFAIDPQAYLVQHNHGRPYPAGVTEPQIIFVQVSMSSYSSHTSKIPHLEATHDGWKYSVFRSYLIAFGMENLVGASSISEGKLPRRI